MLSNIVLPTFMRPTAKLLAQRLTEPRRFIQVVTGPRQVGKTTLVRQVLPASNMAFQYASADEPTLRGRQWIEEQWDVARLMQRREGMKGVVIALDEVQKIGGWSETVKRLWDEDSAAGCQLKAILLGSAPLLIQRGLTESLAGRFEILHLPHWTFSEMRTCFDWDLDTYLFHGAYPGAAPLIGDPERWSRYILDALIETTIARDVLLLTRVDKPALLRRLFELACSYSGQILSYTKMLGQLQDAGNTTTLSHYLQLLASAGMVTGLAKFSGSMVRRRGSSPKLQVLNTALMTAPLGLSMNEALSDGAFWGRLVESAVGAHLTNAQSTGVCKVFYWREGNHEVDFVVQAGRSLTAIEVKSGRARRTRTGMDAFSAMFKPTRKLLIGRNGISIYEFLEKPAKQWVKA